MANKSCNRCKLSIDTTKERYVKVEDKEGKNLLSKLYFHKECWHEIMTGKAELIQLQGMAKGLIQSMKEKFGGNEVKWQ